MGSRREPGYQPVGRVELVRDVPLLSPATVGAGGDLEVVQFFKRGDHFNFFNSSSILVVRPDWKS